MIDAKFIVSTGHQLACCISMYDRQELQGCLHHTDRSVGQVTHINVFVNNVMTSRCVTTLALVSHSATHAKKPRS